MGCDIHPILEVRRDGKWWQLTEEPQQLQSRNYFIFGLLTGGVVRRDEVQKIFPQPRGFPDDNQHRYGSRYEDLKDNVDLHSASWLSLRELAEAPYSEETRLMLGDWWFVMLDELQALGGLDDVRIVFSFDN